MTETQTKTPVAAKKAPPKKAPAKAPAKKAAPKATTPADRKLRWTLAEAKVDGKPVPQTASVDGHDYAIKKAGEGWKATHTYGGKTETLSDTTFAKAYGAIVTHNRARA